MRCDQCKHWDKQDLEKYNSSWEAGRLGLGECKIATMLSDATQFCKKDDLEKNARVLPDEDEPSEDATVFVEIDSTRKMYVQDASSYRAYLYTKPDFFCALYETEWKKPENSKKTDYTFTSQEIGIKNIDINHKILVQGNILFNSRVYIVGNHYFIKDNVGTTYNLRLSYIDLIKRLFMFITNPPSQGLLIPFEEAHLKIQEPS